MAGSDHKALKRSYREMLSLITSVINEWDPYNLVGGGAPKDEFEAEVIRVAAQIPHIKTAEQLAEVVSRVFSAGFAPDPFSIDSCAPVANRLFAVLQAHGFLEPTP